MSTIVICLLIAALATWQIVEIYHHSELFREFRAFMQADDNLISYILNCPWCLSVWIAGAASLLLITLGVFAGLVSPWWWFSWPLHGFAVSRLANFLNDITHPFCRTPRDEE